jgi:DNA polymerase-1
MFDYIRKDVEEGKVILEWDKNKGPSPAPLLKDKYQSERRKAKTVNFSIAYGKTPKGFATDWNCTIEEAKGVITSWFKDRPEVETWQRNKQNTAKDSRITQTLIGRYRRLDKFFGPGIKGSYFGMGLRRAINTPIQGGAADIVVAAMVKIHHN